jgi:hypothetical protein
MCSSPTLRSNPPLFVLAASAALDKAGEKFVPGLCRACHGANSSGPRTNPFPAPGDDARTGNIGIKFLPFDLDNFDYANDTRLNRSGQEEAFHQLNTMMLKTDPPAAVRQLIDGWYRNGLREQDSQFIPEGWQARGQQLYRTVVKPFCRTCHVAMSPALDFHDFDTFAAQFGQINARVCTPSAEGILRNMPQAPVAFDQFWFNRTASTILSRFLQDAQAEHGARNPARVPCPSPPP